jgi:hypothetical protein
VVAVAVLITLDTTSDVEVFDTVLSAVTYTVELGVAATMDHLSFMSLMTHPNNDLAMGYVFVTYPVILTDKLTWLRFSTSLLVPSCSGGVDWIIRGVPVAIREAAFMAAKIMTRLKARYKQGELGKPNLLFQAANTVRKAVHKRSMPSASVRLIVPANPVLAAQRSEME